MDKNSQINPQELEVYVPEHLRGGSYANVTNLSVTSNELILNFIFANDTDSPKGTLVSRIVVTREHARQLVQTLKDAVTTADELNPKS